MDSGIVFVTTPIGNSADITINAINYLASCRTLYCEDTRKTKNLLERLEISFEDKNFISYHDHSSTAKLSRILQHAAQEVCVYVSDAGSPLISDPAYELIKVCIENKTKFKFCSGITAPIHALEVSGLPATPFQFHGFISRDKGKMISYLQSLGQGTHIFFEGVSRVETTLNTMADVFPSAHAALCRELTKTHEEVVRFKLGDPLQYTLKGEFVILIHVGAPMISLETVKPLAQEILLKGAKPKLVAKLIAGILDLNSKEIYEKLSRN